MVVVLVVPVAGLYLIDTHEYAAGIPLALVGLYLLVFVGIYFGVALYRYALQGEPVGDFTSGELESAVRRRGR